MKPFYSAICSMCLSVLIVPSTSADFRVHFSQTKVQPQQISVAAEDTNSVENVQGDIKYWQVMAFKESNSINEEIMSWLSENSLKACTSRQSSWNKLIIRTYSSNSIVVDQFNDAFLVEVEPENCIPVDVGRKYNEPNEMQSAVTNSNLSKSEESSAESLIIDEVGNYEVLVTSKNKDEKLAIEEVKTTGSSAARYVYTFEGTHSLREVLELMSLSWGLGDVVYDLNGTSVAKYYKKKNYRIMAETLSDVGRQLNRLFNIENPIYLHHVDGNRLVVSTQVFLQPEKIRVFEVQKGRYIDNVNVLASQYGWTLEEDSWPYGDFHYIEQFSYPIVIQNLEDGLVKLSSRYPVQVQMLDNTKQILFASRPMPITQEGN